MRRQAITYTSARLLSIGSLRTNFSEIRIEIPNSSFTKMHIKSSSAKWRGRWVKCDYLIGNYGVTASAVNNPGEKARIHEDLDMSKTDETKLYTYITGCPLHFNHYTKFPDRTISRGVHGICSLHLQFATSYNSKYNHYLNVNESRHIYLQTLCHRSTTRCTS